MIEVLSQPVFITKISSCPQFHDNRVFIVTTFTLAQIGELDRKLHAQSELAVGSG